MIVEITVLVLLIIIGIIDVKTKKIPSIFLSGILLVVAFVNIQNLNFGVLSLLYAWFLYDADFIKGMADVKVIGIIGFMIVSPFTFLLFLVLVVGIGTVYNWSLFYIMKLPEGHEIPFIPVLIISYVALLIYQNGWLPI